MRPGLATGVALTTLLLTTATASPAAEPTARSAATCSDYSNQADAQRAADTRDADGDGIYCESLPCPCLRPGQGGGSDPPRRRKAKPKTQAQVISARITDVVDGDTVKVRAYGARRSRYTVRLIGIDTPETRRPGVTIECGGPEASASMEGLAMPGGRGRRVTLTTDPSQDTFDRYRRLLAYVETRSGRQLNVAQIAAGWSKTYVFRKRFRQYGRFRNAERRARRGERGVWSQCGGDFHRAGAAQNSSVPRADAAAGCRAVAYAGRSYVLYRVRVGCRFAKRWVRRLHRTGGGPRGWRCESGSGFETGGGCRRGDRVFGWHPAD